MADNTNNNSVTSPEEATAHLQYAARYAASQTTDANAVAQAAYGYAVAHGVSEAIAAEYAPQFAAYFVRQRQLEEGSDSDTGEAETLLADDEYTAPQSAKSAASYDTYSDSEAETLLADDEYTAPQSAKSAASYDTYSDSEAETLLADDEYTVPQSAKSAASYDTYSDSEAEALLADDEYTVPQSAKSAASYDTYSDSEAEALLADDEYTAPQSTKPTNLSDDSLLVEDTSFIKVQPKRINLDASDDSLAAALLVEDDTYDDSNRKKTVLGDDIGEVKLDDDAYDDSNRRNTSLDDIETPVLTAEMKVDKAKTDAPSSDEILSRDVGDVVLAEDSFDDKAFREKQKEKLKEKLKDDEQDHNIKLDDMSDKYKSTYVRKETEDEKAAKKLASSAAYKAKKALGDTSGAVSEESRAMYRALKAEQNARLAKKGFGLIWIVIVLGGGLAAMIWAFFSYVPMPDAFKATKVMGYILQFSEYYYIAMAVVSVLTLLRVGLFKSLASLMYVMNVVIMVPSFALITSREGNDRKLSIALFAGIIVVSLFCLFFINTNDAIEMFYKRKDVDKTY